VKCKYNGCASPAYKRVDTGVQLDVCAWHARSMGKLPATVMCAACDYENQVLPGTDRCDRCAVPQAALEAGR
jgi:hypothetical protein